MVRRQAHSWFVRLRGPRGTELQEPFRRWYDADPANAAAFNAVSRHFEQSGVARQSEFWRGSSLKSPAAPVAGKPRYALAAAAIALILLVPAGFFLRSSAIDPFGRTHVLLLATSLGEIKKVELADGSTLTLDTGTAVRVELQRSMRRAVLRQGRVRFHVAPDSRPFIVDSYAATVIMREAVVDVARTSKQSRVEVLAGTVTVERQTADQRAGNVALREGEGLATSGPVPAQKYRVTSAQPDWTRGMLQFNATPLAEAVAQANLYSPGRKIVLPGDVAAMRVTGAYRIGDLEGLARSLAAAFHLTLSRSASGDFLLTPEVTSTGENKKGR